MEFDFSFWRFVIYLHIAKSWLWMKDGNIWLLHIGQFSKEFPSGKQTAWQIVILMFSLKIGYIKKEKK